LAGGARILGAHRVRDNGLEGAIAKGGAQALAVSVDRIDGYDGPIDVRLDGLPSGFSCPPSCVESRQTRSTIGLAAAADATDPPSTVGLTLVGEATIDGKLVSHATPLAPPSLMEPGDIVTTVEQPELVIRSGREAILPVRIERRNGFTGRVPIEMRGLPHGVRVLHIGLNGIMITERESQRGIVIYAEPWVAPRIVPIVVVAKREDKNTEHAAPAVPLRVIK
jgi:hypothetical protein